MSLTLLLKSGFIGTAIAAWQMQPYLVGYFMLGAMGVQIYELTHDGKSARGERLKLTFGFLGFFVVVGICALALGF